RLLYVSTGAGLFVVAGTAAQGAGEEVWRHVVKMTSSFSMASGARKGPPAAAKKEQPVPQQTPPLEKPAPPPPPPVVTAPPAAPASAAVPARTSPPVMAPPPPSKRMQPYSDQLGADLGFSWTRVMGAKLWMGAPPAWKRAEDKPAKVLDRFLAPGGAALVEVYPLSGSFDSAAQASASFDKSFKGSAPYLQQGERATHAPALPGGVVSEYWGAIGDTAVRVWAYTSLHEGKAFTLAGAYPAGDEGLAQITLAAVTSARFTPPEAPPAAAPPPPPAQEVRAAPPAPVAPPPSAPPPAAPTPAAPPPSPAPAIKETESVRESPREVERKKEDEAPRFSVHADTVKNPVMVTLELSAAQAKALRRDPALGGKLFSLLRIGDQARFAVGDRQWIIWRNGPRPDPAFDQSLQAFADGARPVDFPVTPRGMRMAGAADGEPLTELAFALHTARSALPLLDLTADQLAGRGDEKVLRGANDGPVTVLMLGGEGVTVNGKTMRSWGQAELAEIPAGDGPVTVRWKRAPERLMVAGDRAVPGLTRPAAAALAPGEKKAAPLASSANVVSLRRLTLAPGGEAWDSAELAPAGPLAFAVDMRADELGPGWRAGAYRRVWIVTVRDGAGLTQRQIEGRFDVAEGW
ncbi:MAG: hypothetical protein HY804_03975, partial [Nitrospinae bacterium]|nr:hypothetical protein [Nitrospinota bacterium]